MSITHLPSTLAIGGGVIQHIPQWLQTHGFQQILMITDPTMVALGYAIDLQQRLADTQIHCDIFSDTIPEPTAASIQQGVQAARTKNYDALLALGGGSPIDSAKAIALLCQNQSTVRDIAFPVINNTPGLPVIAVPTTAGTGSEVTRFTIITDETTDEKLLCLGSAFVPTAAFVDYELTLSVPPRTTADTGIDAITHAIEAYVSRRANPYSDSQALAALRLLGPNITTAYHDGTNHAARSAMMLGSTLAGIAFSSASVALVHGMSRPIGAFFHVPHGLSNAMLLPSITEFSITAAPERYAHCAVALGYAQPHDSISSANQKLISCLKALNQELHVPSLAQFGIQKEHYQSVISTMSRQALASGSPSNNPRIPTQEELQQLYQALWQ